jgi:hypothetical protein
LRPPREKKSYRVGASDGEETAREQENKKHDGHFIPAPLLKVDTAHFHFLDDCAGFTFG